MTASIEHSQGLVIQGFQAPLALKDFKLIAFDMDSTLINIECIDEIADAAGKKAEVAAITEAAMRGEITDFKDSLRRRVALLKGVPAEALQQVYEQRLKLNPGAPELIDAAKAVGLQTLLPALLAFHHEGRIPLIDLIQTVTSAPAELLGLPAGRLAKGAPADLVLCDPDAPVVIDADKLLSKSKNSPFDGRRLQGRVLRTVVGGRTVYEA